MNDISDDNYGNKVKNHAEIIGITFAELREGRCKLPLGRIDEPPEFFCGAETMIGNPYCSNCMKIVYVPKTRR